MTGTPAPAIGPTLLTFAGWYILLAIVVALIQAFVINGHSTGLSIGSLMGAGCAAVLKFAKLQGRTPVGGETAKLAALSTLIAFLVSAIPLAALMWIGGFSLDQVLSEGGDTGADFIKILYFVVPAVVLLYFVVLWITYGPFGRYIWRTSQKTNS